MEGRLVLRRPSGGAPISGVLSRRATLSEFPVTRTHSCPQESLPQSPSCLVLAAHQIVLEPGPSSASASAANAAMTSGGSRLAHVASHPGQHRPRRRASVAHGSATMTTFERRVRGSGGALLARASGGEREEPAAASAEEAAEFLREASESQDARRLLRAIGQAKSAGVDASLVADATKLLQRLESKAALDRAVEREDVHALAEAMERARRAGCGPGDLAEAEGLAASVEAERRLRCAMALREISPLQWALEQAPKGVRERTLDEARELLAQLEAQRNLEVAACSKNRSRILEALSMAEAAGVDPQETSEARSLLAQLELPTFQKGKLPNAGCGSASTLDDELDVGRVQFGESERLSAAIRLNERAPLEAAIRLAKKAGGLAAEVKVAEQALSRINAGRALDAAVRMKDAKKMKTAILKAERKGLDREKIDDALRLLECLCSRDALDRSIKSRNPEELREAVERARASGCDSLTLQIESAERILEQLLTKASRRASPRRRLSTTGSVARLRV
eukprot:TRINITY_DN28836_c0_g1_i1.p1 TRINITY_DN28836_c0_g1~~TRINITY_DN28836_c0_g1_i1.p1  ORF type:complete len:536 (+),score=104.25 TRINITY_DN28836_c0_g1_i1:74-1609(+)